ncbi:MAG: membrane protein [Acutalibacter sp.]|jgi:uncharacterized membrane protein YczE|uniref:YczE/YyaS/YitT family protein n=1 Tax=Acutalibacter sp. TaxID=1918636 RepID=UPI0021719F00|nr:DUF6198 family protein [Acutalibacter sp.]MCI9225107.1 membrane protein [Acutalibacter sp.]
MDKLFERFRGQQMVRRTVIMLIAVIIMGMGVGFFMHAAMGSDPFSTLNLGVSSKLNLSFGVWQAIFNAILLVIIVFVDRSKLGIGTIGNMLLVGFSADIMSGLLANILPPASGLGIISRVLLTVLGVLMQLVGCSFYVTCDLGMAPYDCISYIVPERTKIPFRWWRILIDVICVGTGFACGAAIGIGTLMMAFGTGPLLPIFNKYLAAPVVGRKMEK